MVNHKKQLNLEFFYLRKKVNFLPLTRLCKSEKVLEIILYMFSLAIETCFPVSAKLVIAHYPHTIMQIFFLLLI